MDIIIRKAVSADFPAVYALFREFAVFQRTPEKLPITLEQLIADEAYFQCFVAEAGGGAAVAGDGVTECGGVVRDGVRESSRKYGIGKKLLFSVCMIRDGVHAG